MRLTNLIKPLLILTSVVLSSISYADESKIPAPFRGEDAQSKFTLTYDDISQVLGRYVVDLGMSDRSVANAATPNLNTRLRENIKRKTALEANRFFFEAFKEKNAEKDIFTKIRKSLETIPNEISLAQLTKAEQLAYWLNLYNIGLLEQLVAIYPTKRLESALFGADGMLAKKIFNVAGIELSLHDIQYNIVYEKFNDQPNIVYGFYQGYKGSPRISTSAFNSKNVFKKLKGNAIEFINSNRGTHFDGKKVRVSSFYERNKKMFPNFHRDLSLHLAKYAYSDINKNIENSGELYANIDDWSITDLFGTMRSYGQGATPGAAAMMNDPRFNVSKFQQKFSADQIEFLEKITSKYFMHKGHVTVQDLDNVEPSNKEKITELSNEKQNDQK